MRRARPWILAVIVAAPWTVGTAGPAQAAYLVASGSLTRLDLSTVTLSMEFSVGYDDQYAEFGPTPEDPFGGTTQLLTLYPPYFGLTGNFGDVSGLSPDMIQLGPGDVGGQNWGFRIGFQPAPGQSRLDLALYLEQDYYWEYVIPPGNWPNHWLAGTLSATGRFAAPVPTVVGESAALMAVPEPPGWMLGCLALAVIGGVRARTESGRLDG